MNSTRTVKVLGIDFFDGQAQDVVAILKTSGGLLVVPAAPALINVERDPDYFKALHAADIAIPDSGYMVLLTKLFRQKNIKKISGWQLVVTFFADRDVIASNSIFLVDPKPVEAEANRNYLNSIGFSLVPANSYVAPLYGSNFNGDESLLRLIEAQRPKFIMINIAGGIQEKLGAYLKKNLSYRPAILCTGAAIAFLTGFQAKIPTWADRLFLGWLMRCIQNPRVYLPRYLKAFKLIFIIGKYGANPPG